MSENWSRSLSVPSCAEQECWGWEYRDARLPVLDPFGEEQPCLTVPSPSWVCGLTVRVSNSQRRRGLTCWLAVVGVIVVAPVVWWQVSLVTALVPVFVAGVLVGVAFAWPAWLVRRADIAYSEWLADCEQAQAQDQRDLYEWAARKIADEQRQAAAAARPVWSPLRPVSTERVDIYGGTTRGWQCLLAVAGMSLLGCGTSLTVLDLTCDHIARLLGVWAGQVGVTQRWLSCPEEITGVNLLAGLSAEEIGVVVCDAIHGVEPGPSETRWVDVYIVQQVAEQLRDQPVTIARLHTALQVLLRQVEHAKADGLSKQEARAVADLYGEAIRRTTEPRILQVAACLSRLCSVGGSEGSDPLVREGDDSPLRVVELSESSHKITLDLFRQMVFQVLVHRLPYPRGGSALVVAGADCLPRDQVEWLDQRARRHGTRLILLFRHLREDATDLLGGGDGAMFMRLGNAREAEHAATFIGKEHRFVTSQFTISHSDNTSLSTTGSATVTTSATLGSSGTSSSEGQAATAQQGTSTSESVGYQRVHDYTVSPTLLQGLSPTAFLLVDPRDPGSPRLGECDPAALSDMIDDHHGEHLRPPPTTLPASLPAHREMRRAVAGDPYAHGCVLMPPDRERTA